nr:hypothetical protein [Tanacetum cinerariifolium]
MHNNIMVAGSRDHPPMLAPGRYSQWRSRFLRYVDTRPNGKALRKCILSGPYKPTTVLVHVVEATDDSPAVTEHTTVETPTNMSPENKAHFLAEKEAIHLILTGIGDDIYSTVDACQTAQEMWEAIERLQQGESLNIQDVKTNLFWKFGKFTSRDGESMESYYTRFYKLMNEMIINSLTMTTMQVNVQFLQQLQPEWSRSSTPSPKPSIPSRSHTTTKYKGKEIAKPITPPSETAFEEDSDPKQAQRDKDMQKNLALIAKYFKIYKPTNNNLRISSNSKNKNVDTTPWYKNGNHSGQFGTQRTLNVDVAKENVGSKVVQQSGIQCFNCREFGHFAKECRKPKRVKDSSYHKEKMMLCKQAKQAHYRYTAKIQEVPTADSGTDSKPVEQVQNEAGYNVFANDLQHSEQSESVSYTCLVETDDSNIIPDSPDMCEDDIQNEQNDVNSDDERVALANLKLDTKHAEFEKFKAFNDHTVDYDKLERNLNEALGQLAYKDIVIREGVNHKLTVSRPPFKRNQSRDKVLPNNSQVMAKKTQVEVHPRNPSVSNKMKSVTACNNSLNSRTLNANAVCATCNKCLVDSNHFACVTKMLNDVHARTKKPNVVPISTRKPKSQSNKSIATPNKKKIVQLILFIVDPGCTKYMTGNLKLLCNFIEKFLGTVRFGNDQFAPILGYRDLV